MNEEIKPVEPAAPVDADLLSQHSLLDLFKELSFKEWYQKVAAGLKAPKDSGDYKWAKLQVLRMWAPASAIAVPLLALLILVVFSGLGYLRERNWEVMVITPEQIEELDKIEEIVEIEPPEPEVVPSEVESETMGPSDQPGPGPVGETALFSPQVADFDSVAITKSPMVLRGIYGSRNPGSRGSALAGYGGSGLTEMAVLRALRWLKKYQETDGCWTTSSGGYPQAEHNSAAPAITGLALLTYLAHGETPASEEFGPTIERALKWMIQCQGADGRFTDRTDSNNYGLPIGAYALSEAYGLTRIPMLKDAATKAISVIVNGQNPGMMFNYNCNTAPDRNDMSYSPWCIQALKAAQMAGLEIDNLREVMRKAVEGLKLNWAEGGSGGSFTYTRGAGETPLSCAGVLAMQLLGAGRDAKVQQALVALQGSATCNWQTPWSGQPIYYWYYYTQDMFHAGGSQWKAWNAQFSPTLVKNQIVIPKAIMDTKGKLVDIGYWKNPSTSEHCKAYTYNTTLCALTLTVYYRYLPTYGHPEEMVAEEATVEEADKDIDVQVR